MKAKASMTFNQDDFPNKPKILFIGNGGSSHTHSWIDLLQDAPINVRLFSMAGIPPQDWAVKTYLATPVVYPQPSKTRKLLTPFSDKLPRVGASVYFKLSNPQAWLAKVIKDWKPDIIHTLGLDSGGKFYFETIKKYGSNNDFRWVLQLRGGSDLSLTHQDPNQVDELQKILGSADQIISDNRVNFDYLKSLDVDTTKIASIAPVPGTGGMDIEAMSELSPANPSESRIILWTKAYTTPWTVGLPVLEAIRLAWEQIKPCEIHTLWTTEEIKMWYWTLPADLRESFIIHDRIPREDVLKLMAKSRVLLAPSLLDGIPNVLYEAMASKTFPIVSPIETIKTVVEDEKNVLFARNLYPQEIADALIRAMSDDTLIDQAAETNLALVRQIANRGTIRAKVVTFYQDLVSEKI